MSFKKFRWSQVYESSEEELIDLLEARNLEAERIHAVTEADQHTESIITIWCAEGSLKIKTESTTVSLQPGDALRLEANTTYSVHPGIADCVYFLTI